MEIHSGIGKQACEVLMVRGGHMGRKQKRKVCQLADMQFHS